METAAYEKAKAKKIIGRNQSESNLEYGMVKTLEKKGCYLTLIMDFPTKEDAQHALEDPLLGSHKQEDWPEIMKKLPKVL